MKRIHLIIQGRVQGVFFRQNTNTIANQLGLKGYAKNLPDNTVEVIAEGPEDKLQSLISFCRKGPEGAEVTDIKIKYEEPKNEFTTFSINY